MTLHDRLLAAVTARQVRARAATPGPWRAFGRWVAHEASGCTCGGGAEWPHEPHCGYEPMFRSTDPEEAAFIAAEDPAAVLRHCERDLKVLERHEQATIGGAPLAMHDECRCIAPWPCDDIRDLAAAYAIDTEETS